MNNLKSVIVKIIFISNYLFAKFIGLMPFILNYKHKSISVNIWSTVYPIIIGIFITFATPICFIVMITITSVIFEKAIFSIVISLQQSAGCIITIIIYFLQIKNRKQLVKMINDGFLINESIIELYPNEKFLNRKFLINYFLRLILFIIQTISNFDMIFVLHKLVNDISFKHYISYIGVAYTSIIFTTISTFYYIGMLSSMNFYRILNKKLNTIMDRIQQLETDENDNDIDDDYDENNTIINKNLSKNSKMSIHCELSDSIDRIALLYDRICCFTNSINTLFSIQVLLMIANSFVVIVVQVRRMELLNSLINC